MNDSADYFDSLELHAGEPAVSVPATLEQTLPASEDDFVESLRPEAENLQIADGLEAMLHGDSLEHVVAEVGTACVTRSDVASAVHTAVTDAVQAAVNGVVAVAVAAAVKANSSMNAEDVEKRFRQKYLGIGLPDVPGVDAPFLKAPRLQVEEDGSVALSPDAGLVVVELADNDPLGDPTGDAFVALACEVSSPDDEPEGEGFAAEEAREAVVDSELPAAETALNEFAGVADAEQASPEQTSVEEILLEQALPEQTAPEQALPAQVEAAQTFSGPAVPEPVLPEPTAQKTAAQEPEIYAPNVSDPVVEAVPESPKPLSAPPVSELAAVPERRPSMPEQAREPESVERTLRNEKSVQFVGFQVGTQMYAVPSILIREVIRRQPLSRLPVQTRYAPGVINLRGQVIPVVSLRELLQADMPPEGSRNQFSIITGSDSFGIALEVDKIRSMYVVQQEDIVWNVASVLGLDDDTVIGLFELEERLVPILSVERVAAILLEEGLDLEALSA